MVYIGVCECRSRARLLRGVVAVSEALQTALEEGKEGRAQAAAATEETIRELVEWKERAKSAESRMMVLEARCVPPSSRRVVGRDHGP